MPISANPKVRRLPWPLVALALGGGLALLVSPGGASEPDRVQHFPVDFVFDVSQPSGAPTHQSETFTVQSNQPLMRADLEDFDLVASGYEVHLLIKPPGCDSAANWFDGGWNLPDYDNLLAPIEWGAECEPAGLWTIEVTADADAFATGGLRVAMTET